MVLPPQEKLKEVLNSEASEAEKKAIVEEFHPNFWIVRAMLSGEAFGEIALQAEGDR
jgi:hypothetical protein